MVNLSHAGATIEVPNPAFVAECFKLMIEKDHVTHNCRVVWISERKIGVAFE